MAKAWQASVSTYFALIGAAIATPFTIGAQPTTGAMHGRVVDKTSAEPVANAEITYVEGNVSVTTDSLGRFAFAALPYGSLTFVIRATAYPATQFIVDLKPGQKFDRTIVMDSATVIVANSVPTLPAVAVNASKPVINRRLVDFERRRSNGSGQYLTRAEIERSGAYNLQAAVRGLRGIVYECGGGGGCFVRMARAPMQCLPDYVVDERVNNTFGPSTPIRDIEAIEVYTGPGDVAGEFAGANAGCGVIVIWTRSGPPRRP
jgi:hypothetical protein